MRFVSTRGKAPAVPISEALQTGLAPDGGLYVPEAFPAPDLARFEGLERFPEIAAKVLGPFFSGDPLAPRVREICEEAFSFPLPLKALRDKTSVFELFHGPTAAFKDVGARFLAGCLSRLGGKKRTILVATSGDTGGAVASAFHGLPGFEVAILYPQGGVSGRQQKQLTSWGGNIRAFAVRGSFDDCQRLVKEALADPEIRAARELGSANSINIGRLLPQMAYYAAAGLWYRRLHGAEPAFAVPSGNVGNSVGALWAKRMGFPIRHVALATNANRAVPDYFESGGWKARPSVITLANAMDVGNPSNMERVFHLYRDLDALKRDASSLSVSDETIRETIRRGEKRWGEVWCPHTATAAHLREQEASAHWIIVATAHPAKFETIVEPLVGHAVPVPEALASILSRPSRSIEIEPSLAAFKARL